MASIQVTLTRFQLTPGTIVRVKDNLPSVGEVNKVVVVRNFMWPGLSKESVVFSGEAGGESLETFPIEEIFEIQHQGDWIAVKHLNELYFEAR